MDDYTIYKLIHLIGIFLMFMGFGGLIVRATFADKEDKRLKVLCSVSHGLGLVLTIVGGFGMLATYKLVFGGWVIAKLIIWLAFGGLIVMAKRKPEMGKMLWIVLILLAVVAGYLGLMKHPTKATTETESKLEITQ
jgi:hypothetical protein